MTGTPDEPEGADEADGADGAGSDGDDGDKKKKAPNMNRILKGRLQKLVAKTDDTYVDKLQVPFPLRVLTY